MAKFISELSFRKKIEFYLASWFGWTIIYLLCLTCDIKVERDEAFRRLRKNKQPFLLTIWHGRFFLGAYYFRFWRLVVLVSQHLDGEMIARSIRFLGFETVRGSSTRGGKAAFHKLVEMLKTGKSAVIIPDGPNGPRHCLKTGVIYMAQQSGVPIVPFSFSAKPAFVFKSWDRFMLPKPFAKVFIKIGAPIWIPPKVANRELVKSKQQVESIMIKQEQEADAYFSE